MTDTTPVPAPEPAPGAVPSAGEPPVVPPAPGETVSAGAMDLEATQVLPLRDPSLARWTDPDARLAPGPAVAFRTSPPDEGDESLPTIGHIGRYALKYPIGEGGLGTVYAAWDPLLSRLIAVKTLRLRPGEAAREAFRELFTVEARAAARLSHPHIVTVYDAGLVPEGAYIAMELLKGRDLRALRQEGWRPTPTQAALIARRVADALAFAHGKGVVHRDVKPANIFMVGRTQPRVLDFGIATVAHPQPSTTVPAVDIAAGSPPYMAPEQLRGEPADKRADVYALGVVLYELLTDLRPFQGRTLAEIAEAVRSHEPPPAHEVDPDVPKALSDIAARAMRKVPEERYPSARSMARDLRQWLDEQAASHEPADVAPVPVAAGSPRRGWAVLGGVGLGLGAAVALWAALGAGRIESPRTAVAAGGLVQPTAASPESPVAGPIDIRPSAGSASLATGTAPPTPSTDAEATRSPGSTAPAIAATATAAPARADASAPRPRPVPAPPVRGGAAAAAGPAAQSTAVASATAPAPARATVATGELRLAVSPWGEVEVDGVKRGLAPPLDRLSLPEGEHRVTLRNADFPPHTVTVRVTAGQPAVVRHRFGP